MPVTMQEFLDNPAYTDPQDRPRDRNRKLLIEFFDGRNSLGDPYEELLFVGGIGAGKSFVSSICFAYMSYRLLCLKNPQQSLKLSRNAKIAFINISTSREQAKNVVFTEVKSRIDNNHWFQTFYQPDPRTKNSLIFPKDIFILPVASNEEAPLGYNIFGAVIDEASFHVQTKEKDYAEESYNQITKRIRSRYSDVRIKEHAKVMIITSPRYIYDFAEVKYREDSNPRLYKDRIALWDAKPADTYSGIKFDLGKYLSAFSGTMVPIEYEQDFIRNPEKAMRDLGAQPSINIQGFFRDPMFIPSAANPERQHPWNEKTNDFHDWFHNPQGKAGRDADRYFIHVDLGLNKQGRGDATGFAMGKFDGWQQVKTPDGRFERRPRIHIAYMDRITAPSVKDEIKFETIRKRIYRLREIGYNIYRISYDGWQSTDSRQILESAGFRSELFSVDRNVGAYYAMKEAMLENRLDFYAFQPFIEECQQLEEVKGNKVDHSRTSSKDIADAVAAVTHHCSQHTPGTGILGART